MHNIYTNTLLSFCDCTEPLCVVFVCMCVCVWEGAYFCCHMLHKLLVRPELVEDSSQTPTCSTKPKQKTKTLHSGYFDKE